MQPKVIVRQRGDSMRRVSDKTVILGQNIRRIRISSGCSQKSLARALGVSFQQVQKYECGENRLPAEKLYALAAHFSLPLEAFFEDFDGPGAVACPPGRAQEKLGKIRRILTEP